MPDREKVIRGLEACLAAEVVDDENPCASCPYFFDEMCQSAIKKDALALLREQKKACWISVKDRLPDVMGDYLTRLSDGTYRILGYYDYIDFDKEPRWLEDCTAEELVEVPNVTHWRSLPEPPEEVK